MSNTLQEQSDLAKNFSNILIQILKLEDRYNQFDAEYTKIKYKNPKDLTKYQDFERTLFDYFNVLITKNSSDLLIEIDELSEILQGIINKYNDFIKETEIFKIIKDKDITNLEKGNHLIKENYYDKISKEKKNSNKKSLKKKLEESLNLWNNYYVLKTILYGDPLDVSVSPKLLEIITNGPLKNILESFLKSIKENFDANEEITNTTNTIDSLKEKYINKEGFNFSKNINANKLDKINIINILQSLKDLTDDPEMENHITLSEIYKKVKPLFQRIPDIINTLQYQFTEYANIYEKNIKIKRDLTDYTKLLNSFKEILDNFKNYKELKESLNFTNNINNIYSLKKNNGISLCFAFGSNLLKLYVIHLINKHSEIHSYDYNYDLLPDNGNEYPITPTLLKIIIQPPTKYDILKIFSTPSKYKNCRQKLFKNSSSQISQYGENLISQYGKSLTRNDFRNITIKTKKELIEKILSESREITICLSTKNMVKIFKKIDEVKGEKIQTLPFLSTLTIPISIDHKSKEIIFYLSANRTEINKGSNNTTIESIRKFYEKQDPSIKIGCDTDLGQI